MDNAHGIIGARQAAASTLLSAVTQLDTGFTEAALAESWLLHVANSDAILPFGWYQPPPHGVSVLIGESPSFERLQYGSLREEINWPSQSVRYSPEAILYPYLSAIDRATGMIGDFVGTFYAGNDPAIRSWMAAAYEATLRIARFAVIGQKISEVYDFAQAVMASLGSRNNTLSITGGAGLGADIGHTVPGYDQITPSWLHAGLPTSDLARTIASARTFVSRENDTLITSRTAFTIEPQLLQGGLPMASFHVIVAFTDSDRYIIESFDNLFDYFGMTSWIQPKK